MCIIRWLEGPLGLADLFQNLLLRDLKYQKEKKRLLFFSVAFFLQSPKAEPLL